MLAEFFLGCRTSCWTRASEESESDRYGFPYLRMAELPWAKLRQIGIGRYRQIGFVDLEAVPFGTAQPRDR